MDPKNRKWKTKDGRVIRVKDMGLVHLMNAIRFCERKVLDLRTRSHILGITVEGVEPGPLTARIAYVRTRMAMRIVFLSDWTEVFKHEWERRRRGEEGKIGESEQKGAPNDRAAH